MHQMIDRVRWMKPEAIEAKAESLLREFQEDLGGEFSPPIPVHLLAERHLDLILDWSPIPDDAGGPVLAYIDPSQRELRMNQNSRAFFEKFAGSESFTIAHEIGHWILHVQVAQARQLSFLDMPASKPFVCRGGGVRVPNSLEWQADRFASALLMPEGRVREYVSETSIYSWPALYSMKDVFGVTISALRIRLTDLGIVYVSDDGHVFRSKEEYTRQESFM